MADNRKNAALFKKYLGKMDSIKKEKRASEIFASLSSGKNSYMRIDRLENSNFDFSWIKEIEDCIYDLGEIIANPRETTKTVTNIVPVELARKTGAESVQHLASHTQYIKEVKEDGDVVPNKILNIGSEEDIHTYENRFIATLVRRLVLFIQKRYEFVKNFSILHDEEILYYKTKAMVEGAEVEIETKIKVKSPSDTKAADMSNKAVERILKIREYVMYFYGSKFMKELKTERDVRNPIVMTNILRKNPKYNHCYRLYKFLERYDHLGVSFKIDEDASIFTDEELNELNTVMFTNYLALKGKSKSVTTKGFSRTYKPRILTSLDDEEFIYGDLLKGPIEFLRIDQGYQDYLDSQLKKDIPPHPTKIEKEYYEEEIEEKNIRKVEKAALDKLEKRKRKDKAEFDKRARAIIAQREREEAERIAREQEAIRLAEERRIDDVRRQLIEEALSNHPVEELSPVSRPEVEDLPTIDDYYEAEYNEELPIEEEEISEEQPQEEVVEETISEGQVSEEIEESPVEEGVEETPVEEVQEAPVEEEQPAVEEPQQVEEAPIEEEVHPVEEAQVEEPETIEESLTEEESPVEEIVDEQPSEEVEEAPQEEPSNEDELEAARRALIEDAIQEEQIDENPVENEEIPAETPSIIENNEEEQPEIAEDIPPVEEEIPAEESPVEEEVVSEEEPAVEESQELEETPVEEVPAEENNEVEPVKKSWGGARSGAGRKKKVAQEESNEEQPVKKSWGGSRAGAGRKKKVSDEEPVNEEVVEEQEPIIEEVQPVEEQPIIEETPIEEEPVIEEAPIEEEPIEEEPQDIEEPIEEVSEEQPEEDNAEPVKKSWGGSRAGAGRKKKVIEETDNDQQDEEHPVRKNWGGSRAGAGRKKKADVEESESANKKNWGGARSGAGRKKKPVQEPVPQEEEEVLEKIPGKFIVKTNMGYYVGNENYSHSKHDAHIFDDFNEANQIKKQFGGKVVKL